MRLRLLLLTGVAALSLGCRSEFALRFTKPPGTSDLNPPSRVAVLPYLHPLMPNSLADEDFDNDFEALIVAYTIVHQAKLYSIYWREVGSTDEPHFLGYGDAAGCADYPSIGYVCLLFSDAPDVTVPIEITITSEDVHGGQSVHSQPAYTVPIGLGYGGLPPPFSQDEIVLEGQAVGFGASLAVRDVDGDGLTELAVGSDAEGLGYVYPGVRVGGLGSYAPGTSASVFSQNPGLGGQALFGAVATGTPGLVMGGRPGAEALAVAIGNPLVEVPAPSTGDVEPKEFGAAIALQRTANGIQLLVGAPSDENPTGQKTGAVYRYRYVPGMGGWLAVGGPTLALEEGVEYGRSLAVGDFDGTGLQGWAVGQPGSDAVEVTCSASGDVTRIGSAPLGIQRFGDRLVVADVNGDGRDDLIVGGNDSRAAIVESVADDGICGFAAPRALEGGSGVTAYGRSLAAGDINADGFIDVMVGGIDSVGRGFVGFHMGDLGGPAASPSGRITGNSTGFAEALMSGDDVDRVAPGANTGSSFWRADDLWIGDPTKGEVRVIRGTPARGPIVVGPSRFDIAPGEQIRMDDVNDPIHLLYFELPVRRFDCDIDWGDGSPVFEASDCGQDILRLIRHTYNEPGMYTLVIRGFKTDAATGQPVIMSSSSTLICVGMTEGLCRPEENPL